MTLDNTTFCHVGAKLFGPSWQGALATSLSLSRRTMQRYVNENGAIPLEIWMKLADLADQAAVELDLLAGQIDDAVAARRDENAEYGAL